MNKRKQDNINKFVSNEIKIIKSGIIDIFRLPGMFTKALFEEYKMYDEQTKKRILQRHSLLHLLIARFKPDRVILLAAMEKRGIAVVLGTYSSDGVGIVHWIYVLPEYRKKNVAKRMLLQMEQEFLKRNCHKLTVTTEVAWEFYRKIGYKQEAFLKNHWWGEDFYFFSKFLK